MEYIMDLLYREEIYHPTLQELVNDLIQIFKDKRIKITDAFIVLIVKIVSLDPQNKFLVKQPIERMEVERLKKVVTERVLSMTPATRNVLRMQLHYRTNYFSRLEIIKARRLDLENRIRKSLTEMIKAIPKHQRHYDTYYEKLIIATIIKSGMGPSSEFQVVKETQAALNTIFPKEDINLLTTMTPKGREIEIRHLMKMTAGIRLYNRDLDPTRLGAGIVDLPKLLPERINSHLKLLFEMRERNVRRLIVYTTLTKPYFLNEEATTNKYGKREFSEDMVWIRHGLIMIHQLLIYVKELTEDLTNEQKLSENLISQFHHYLTDLKTTMNEKEHVATFILYPKFVGLANSWEKLQDAYLYAESCGLLINALQKFSEDNLKEIDPTVLEMADLNQIPTEKEFFDFPEYVIQDDPFAVATRATFTIETDPSDTQYSGFCVWSLVKGYGLVVLSNPNLGIYTWKGRQYLFSSPEGATDFGRNPDIYIYKAMHVARRWPQLIYLLNLEEDIFSFQFSQAADRATIPVDAKIIRDSGIQTETHPIESNIVQGYTWNEWELRKQAIILSTIHKCATHSTQTHWQALKKTQEVQTYSSRNRRIQTKLNKYCEAPRNQFYFYGLRGLHEYPPHIVELTKEPVLDLRCLVKPPATLEEQLEMKKHGLIDGIPGNTDNNNLTLLDFIVDPKKRDR